jgi:hypothetical protein
MHTSEYFRQKVNQLLETLKRAGFKDAVASQANLIVSKLLASGDKVLNLDVKAVNQQAPQHGEIYLQSQDVFLAEKIAYYRLSQNGFGGGGFYFSSSDMEVIGGSGKDIFTMYRGTLAFIQNRTIVSSLLSLHEFVKRENTATSYINPTSYINASGFDTENCAKTLMPYWLLSGQRDNQIQVEYQQPINLSDLEASTRIFVNIKGVLIPNASQALGNIDLGL